MAERAGSVVEEVKASHVSMISRPNAVTELIETAAEATAGEDSAPTGRGFMAPDGVEPSHADSKSAALSTELRGRVCQSSAMETEAAARAWIEGWSRAWPAADPGMVASLYAEDVSFRSEPFRELQDPRAYAEWAFSEQDEAQCWYGEPIVSGDRAVVEYWGVIRYRGNHETIAGIAVIRFDSDGLVCEQHDYWNAHEGRREPPEGWGR
jgi:ketosteroid isomerase-like protein